MKIKITKTCECMYGDHDAGSPDDVRLKKGMELEGMAIPVSNWQGNEMECTDFETDAGLYSGIPNDSFEEI